METNEMKWNDVESWDFTNHKQNYLKITGVCFGTEKYPFPVIPSSLDVWVNCQCSNNACSKRLP